MTVRVGINGFGRIGRMVFRAIKKDFPELEVVGINDLLENDYLAYMLKYDTAQGRFDGDIAVEGDNFIIDGKQIRLSAERNPADLKWGDIDVDIAIDCTGFFLTTESCQAHIDAGAKKVVQSAPAKDGTPMFVYGVNHDSYDGQTIVSAASCTTNCLAPIAKIVNDNWGLKRGLMTTVHASTATQKTVDGPSMKDWRGGRAVFENIIPSSTGAAKAVGVVLPELNGKLTGMAFRIPSVDVSVVDLTCELDKSVTYEEICATIKATAETTMKGTLQYTEDMVVSSDFRGVSASSIFDANAGIALDGTFVKLVSWYDNEYGYTCNMLRLVKHIA
ncbi:MAG: type I glyceraldehyde-3-phosphate dehydrogenase [Candidatus Thiodubiliella endoseptemdiera]|uniref:Glyceraldehyde-3-phosphate dehydrogenase n=1 Tax=Candidatus Thiodubiliella endoseptemdiera TaxID=2738886 RepID=A0A853F1G1_9GAMM|nr:type I glyceraldehyde-3-phosphate dehydrogenase [Candidatus Thiodubiliella endoseptemdiera]